MDGWIDDGKELSFFCPLLLRLAVHGEHIRNSISCTITTTIVITIVTTITTSKTSSGSSERPLVTFLDLPVARTQIYPGIRGGCCYCCH